ncbi:GxxExxY protein [Thiohalorhabdus denitrificans]|uniref:GxxExxY protein n=1 Tax=Thiohalorhabdus denitrificans TaxID=381306 RepID=A0A0P9C3E1_9GAMM|nr:GxxExxY protein [Thiohalorhabdus denitrificans]KPV39233.1 GxxExxY protein [Thiohalorhabdus denitrificans]SCX75014.1 GxxExxY protein [Thiohalorhabdus denitrificans]
MEPSERADFLARETIGAAVEVHSRLGPGFLEGVYEEALAIELTERGVPFGRQEAFEVRYKNHGIGQGRLDLLVGGELIVELKAVEKLLPIHKAQVISYLKAMDLCLGLLINFNARTLKEGLQRVVLS